ncbi:GGDEF domain-containing protein [Amycolatopsis nalaikhensis]|uniref:GGDEF domain-containing protein n=1 Tax=Amycolatopsis nalaikhensis TaxID=715472 RepID=A0ABY8XER9_9PSEU|nr:GGDEF domain-containing protein [Amycolatopsis sp. 2-2]WIV54105.1 GGDEF domain-containing protein [Amycolatopsis sp. 2-2]
MGDRDHAGGTGVAVRRLRSRWRIASITSGWRFPSDWAVPEVDTVCGSALFRGDLTAALTGLGGSRARTGAGLDETLYDVAALHAVLDGGSDADGLISADPHAAPLAMLRAAAVGWADVASALTGGTATEPDTGLATEAYLRTRLGEVYRAAAAPVLLAIEVDLARVAGWSRPMAMALVADVLREVFDGGETTAALGESTAVVLAERDADLGHRIRRVRRRIADRLSADPQLAAAAHPRVRSHHLPDTLAAAHDLLYHLGGRG